MIVSDHLPPVASLDSPERRFEERLGLGGQTAEPKQKRSWRSSDVPLGDVPASLSAPKIENHVIGNLRVERLTRKDDGRGADIYSPLA